MLTTRREFVQWSLAASAALSFPAHALARSFEPDSNAADFLKWEKLADGAFVATGSGGNSLLLVGKDGGVLSDCKNAPYGMCLRREAESRSKKLLRVVNTHHHGDHTGGNHAFSTDIEIIAQDNCTSRVLGQMSRYISQLKEAVKQLENEKGEPAQKVREENIELYHNVTKLKDTQFAPKTTFKDTYDLAFPGIKVKLSHFGPGHTDNDIIIHDADRNIIHTGDLLFHKMFPFVDKASGADTRSWQQSVKKIIALCDAKTKVVPGHGDVTDVEGLQAQHDFFEVIHDEVAAAIKAGKTRKQVGEMQLSKYADYGLKQMESTSLMTVFDEQTAGTK